MFRFLKRLFRRNEVQPKPTVEVKMPWYVSMIIEPLAKLAISILEQKFPGLGELLNIVEKLLGGGATMPQIQAHLSTMPGPADLVSDNA